MPLKRGRSKKVFSRNVAELRRGYKKKKKIGKIKPKDEEHARRIALAIAYKKMRKS